MSAAIVNNAVIIIIFVQILRKSKIFPKATL